MESDPRPKLGDVAASAGLHRIHILSWRDLDDVEAGGSERWVAEVGAKLAEAGIDVTLRTSHAQGQPPQHWRDGVRVLRRGGRYQVFPRAAFSEATGRHGPADGLIEVWNAAPWFSPLWSRRPCVTVLHHVYLDVWPTVLPPRLARAGQVVEGRLAPLAYRRARVVTMAESSKREIVARLGLDRARVSVVPPGVDPRFTPGPGRSPEPLVVAVGRLLPVKRLDALLRILADLRATEHPELRAVILGDGYERDTLRQVAHDLDADSWVRFTGPVDDAAMVEWYRRAWLLASASQSEGWGLAITEAAACGTPAAVTDIPGHADNVIDGVTGLRAGTARDPRPLGAAIDRLLRDHELRERLGRAAAARAGALTWDATAAGVLDALAAEAHARAPR